MKLFQNVQSPNAKRIRAVARELGVPVEVVEVAWGPTGTQSPEYLARNPNGMVPTVEVEPGKHLWESPAILAYLAATHPDKKLLPTEPYAFADTLRWMFWSASHLEAQVRVVVEERLLKPMFFKQPTDENRLAAAVKGVERYAPVLNAQLEGKQWVTGDSFTIADIAIGTTVETAAMVGVDLTTHTHIKQWFQRLQARACWKD